jgi:protein-S-isoprenylcysteine O-methyltransferase Ste14
MEILKDPFFWAFLAALGWAMGMLTVGSTTVGRYMLYGIIGSFFAQVPRIILPLKWVSNQPWFVPPLAVGIIGAMLCLAALFFAFPGLGLNIYTRPSKDEPLVTTGFFGIVRHPILFANVLWPLGWSLICGSWIGVALWPIWSLLAYLMSFIEEDRMIEAYGDAYRLYRTKVPRIIPFVKFL